MPGEQWSPRRPAFRRDGPWSDRGLFHARARAYGGGAPRHPVELRAGAGLALIGILAAILTAVRTRVRRRA